MDTLVAKAHRGHRLGMLVKVLNLRRLQKDHPEVELVVTFNAVENDHMLAINVALGFRAAGYDGECTVPALTGRCLAAAQTPRRGLKPAAFRASGGNGWGRWQ